MLYIRDAFKLPYKNFQLGILLFIVCSTGGGRHEAFTCQRVINADCLPALCRSTPNKYADEGKRREEPRPTIEPISERIYCWNKRAEEIIERKTMVENV